MSELRETALYPPIKAFLEGQGYEVKGEVASCDLVAVREGGEPVIVELKTRFSLPLVLQGVRRQAISDCVYLAFAAPGRPGGKRAWQRQQRDILTLCRRLGLGLIAVRLDAKAGDHVAVHLDPGPYMPRKQERRQGMLLREFQRRVGDPNIGGTSKRPIVTAYRQDALKCACYLQQNGASALAKLRAETGVQGAARILQRDVYGWFQRVARGTYELSPRGGQAMVLYADVIETLSPRSVGQKVSDCLRNGA